MIMIWKDRSNVRVGERFVGIHESTQEILAAADYRYLAFVGDVDCPFARICGGSIYIYLVLMAVIK